MSITASAVQRDAAGRFLPGRSGNPLGKAPGTRNRATALRQLLRDGEDRVIGRVLIDKAKSGDAVAARFVISHVMPRPRSRAIELDLPEGTWPGDIVASFNATMVAMAMGEITPDEALTITRTFDGRIKALKAYEMERHLTRYEQIPGDTAFEAEEDEEYEEEEEDDAPATARTEPSPACWPFDKCSGGHGEGAAPANHLHSGDSPHPDPLPQAGEGADLTVSGVAPADAPTEPSPCDAQIEPSPACSQRGFATPDAAAGTDPPPATPAAPLHSACIQPSPATIAGRRRVAEQALRQWARTMPR